MVVGGSFGGLTAAEHLRASLGRADEVWLVSDRETFTFRPSLPWVVFGLRRPGDVRVPLEPVLRSRGITFLHDRVDGLDATARRLFLGRNGAVSYDFLVLALGARPREDEPRDWTRHAHTLLWLDDAMRLRRALKQLIRRGRRARVVFAIGAGAALLCPPYEVCLWLDETLRRAGVRDRVELRFVTAEERLFSGAARAHHILARRLEGREIRWHATVPPSRVHPDSVELADGRRFPADLAMVMPAYRGPEMLGLVPGLVDPGGFVVTDRRMRSLRYPEIYGVGDVVAFPGPKLGVFAEEQAQAAAADLLARVGRRWPGRPYRSLFLCLAELGEHEGLLLLRRPAPRQGSARLRFALPGRLPHLGKVLFEQYYLRWRLRA